LGKRMNALDWYHEGHCSHCDVPSELCSEGSHRELACIMARILYELQK